MKYCEYCGKPMNDFATFCSGCGRKCQEGQTTYCEHCGQMLPAEATACTRCGMAVQQVCGEAVLKTVKQKKRRTVRKLQPEADCPVSQIPRQPMTESNQPANGTGASQVSKRVRKLRRMQAAVAALAVIGAGLAAVFLLGETTAPGEPVPNPPEDTGALTETERAETPVIIQWSADQAGNSAPIAKTDVVDMMETVNAKAGNQYIVQVKGDPYAFEDYNVEFINSVVSARKSGVSLQLKGFLDQKGKSYVDMYISTGGAMQGVTSGIYTKEQYEDTRNIIIALEKTLTGNCQAEKYLKSYPEMQDMTASLRDSFSELYLLDNRTVVEITITARDTTWVVSYSLRVYR